MPILPVLKCNGKQKGYLSRIIIKTEIPRVNLALNGKRIYYWRTEKKIRIETVHIPQWRESILLKLSFPKLVYKFNMFLELTHWF